MPPGAPLPNPIAAIKRQLPETLEDLYNQKIECMGKAIKYREERNWGRRMTCWTNEYSWQATPWDWTLEELKYIGADTYENMKWKRAAAFKLASEAKIMAPKMIEEWRYKETSTRLVALKSSVLIKQAFYTQYSEMKRLKDEYMGNPTTPPINPMASRLQDIMRHMIANYGFQHDIPEVTYKDLYKKLNPQDEKKEPSAAAASSSIVTIPKPPNLVSATSAAASSQPLDSLGNKNPDGDLFVLRFSSHDIVPSSAPLYEPFPDYNDDAPRIMTLRDPTADHLLAFPHESIANMNLANLPDIPPVNYDELLSEPLKIQGRPKPIEVKAEPMTGVEGEERKVLEEIENIVFMETETAAGVSDDSQGNGTGNNNKKAGGTVTTAATTTGKKPEEEEGYVFFDVTKQLLHTLPKPEDPEFMDYMTNLPECSDPLYHKINQK